MEMTMAKNQLFKNTFLHGLSWGLIIPIVTFGILYGINQALRFSPEVDFMFKEPTLVLAALFFNSIPAFRANKRHMDHFIRGIAFPTVIGAFIWLYIYDPIQMFS